MTKKKEVILKTKNQVAEVAEVDRRVEVDEGGGRQLATRP
jgi:hypothetical protein